VWQLPALRGKLFISLISIVKSYDTTVRMRNGSRAVASINDRRDEDIDDGSHRRHPMNDANGAVPHFCRKHF